MLKQMMNLAVMHLGNKKGQGMVEYALIIGLVAVVLVGALILLSGGIENTFDAIIEHLPGGEE
ncbi:Flp family type IVb pilin [Isachenkonia alkalipeptolytica]|nr:Flp family type IVb pilin [Isachenkonia alkalipeptolytica]